MSAGGYARAKKIYDRMRKDAVTEDFEGQPTKIWTGSLSNLAAKYGAKGPFYAPAMRFLQDTGSILVIQRGVIGYPSKVAVRKAPTKRQHDQWLTERPVVTKRNTEIETLQQQINDINERLGGIDIRTALVELEGRVSKLERTCDDLSHVLESHKLAKEGRPSGNKRKGGKGHKAPKAKEGNDV